MDISPCCDSHPINKMPQLSYISCVFSLSLQVTVFVWAPAQTKKTLVGSTWTSPRPETTSMSGSVGNACWPERRGTGAKWRRIAFGRPPLLPSSTTQSTSAASLEIRSKVCRQTLNLQTTWVHSEYAATVYAASKSLQLQWPTKQKHGTALTISH